MTKEPLPPRWADRFLKWYCNPDLLEEIQGDAHELYSQRVAHDGIRTANLKYIWDIIRFCRLSNIRRPAEYGDPNVFSLFWNVNLKMVTRRSMKNKMFFGIKLSALAISIAFALLLSGFVLSELTFDHHHKNFSRLYRIGCNVDFMGKQSNYAVTPLPMGPTLVAEIPEVEASSRFMIMWKPAFEARGKSHYGIVSYAADSNFLRLFDFDFIDGTRSALDRPNSIVLTESIARRLFGTANVSGKSIKLSDKHLEVTAIIKDLPLNTHFTFQVLVSWDTFERNDEWTNINAYTYIRTAPGISKTQLDTAIRRIGTEYLAPMANEYTFTFKPIIQRIDDIHTSGFMDEDFVVKRNSSYVYIIGSVAVLLLLTGLFNFLNLALAELTLQLRKIAVLRAFGGARVDHRKIAATDCLLCLLIVSPLVVAIMNFALWRKFIPAIDPAIWTHPAFIMIVCAIAMMIVISSVGNGFIVSKESLIVAALKGALPIQNGFSARKVLVACQLAFSIVMIGLITVIVEQFRFVDRADKGFDDRGVIVLRRTGSNRENFAWEEAIRKLAGVQRVAGSSFYPEGGVETKDMFEVQTSEGSKTELLNYIFCEREYPELLGMRLISGRFFEAYDLDNGTPRYLVNEAAARQLGWTDPIGKKIHYPVTADNPEGEVVGVVKDFHFESMHAKIEPLVIVLSNGEWGTNFVYVKSNPGASPLQSIEKSYKATFPDTPLEWGFLDSRYRSLYQNDYEMRDIFSGGFFISILLSALGIFSISALILTLRTKEMGIRKVIGAGDMHLLISHLKPFLAFFFASIAIGLPLEFFLSRQWLDNFAYHVSWRAGYFLIPTIGTLLIILAAAGYHAIRCTRVNPIDILRQE